MVRRKDERPRVLFIAANIVTLNPMLQAIRASGYKVLSAFTAEQGVAVCMGNQVDAVVLDAAFITQHSWPVAKSLKLIKPALPILLLYAKDSFLPDNIPAEIDASVSNDLPQEMVAKLRRMISRPAADAATSAQ